MILYKQKLVGVKYVKCVLFRYLGVMCSVVKVKVVAVDFAFWFNLIHW